MIREALGSGGRFGLRIDYVDEGDDLRGSGGALRLALDRGILPEQFFVLYVTHTCASISPRSRSAGVSRASRR